MIVHTRTQEQWDFVTKKNNLTETFDWDSYKEKSCIDIEDNSFGKLDHYKYCVITPFEQWLKESGHEKEWYSEFLKNKKIWIGENAELMRRVQHRLFKLDIPWCTGSCKVDTLGSNALYISSNNTFSHNEGRNYFEGNNDFKEITLQDLGIEERSKYDPRKGEGELLPIVGIKCEGESILNKPKFKVGDEVYLISRDKAKNLFYDTKYKISHVSLGSEWIRLENPPDNLGIFYPMDHFDFWHNHPSQKKETKTFKEWKEELGMPLFEIGKDPPPWTRMYQTCFAGCDPYKPEGGLPDKETVEAYYKAFGNKKKINLISKHKIVNFKNQKS